LQASGLCLLQSPEAHQRWDGMPELSRARAEPRCVMAGERPLDGFLRRLSQTAKGFCRLQYLPRDDALTGSNANRQTGEGIRMMTKRLKNFFLGVTLVAGLERQLEAQQTEWKIGLAKARITPEQPIRMAGYSDRTQPSQSVSSDLYAKALALEDRDGNRALLITADIIGFTQRLAEPIYQRLKTSTG